MSFLLDTNVVSELRKATPDPRVARWRELNTDADAYLSVLVIGEVRRGIEHLRRRGDVPQADGLEAWLELLTRQFAERLLGITAAVAERWGRLTARQPLPAIDALMAATALEHDLTFVTRDTEPLVGTGARLLDPWSM
jgi:toxin FitB